MRTRRFAISPRDTSGWVLDLAMIRENHESEAQRQKENSCRTDQSCNAQNVAAQAAKVARLLRVLGGAIAVCGAMERLLGLGNSSASAES